jgi:hypothetical protein
MEIQSYRRVFDLERRIYRVDRLRLNPGGVPVRGVVYFLVTVSIAVAGGKLPLLGVAAEAMPWYLRDLVLPAVSAALLTVIRVEGRPFHVAARALARYRIGTTGLSAPGSRPAYGGRWHPGEITFLPDGSDSRMRHLRYTGPGAVLVALQHERAVPAARSTRAAWRRRPPAVVLRALPGGCPLERGQVIALGPRARLLVRATSAQGPVSR